jgi:long-chain acyl-CoA synthetase
VGLAFLDVAEEHAAQNPHGAALVCGDNRIGWADLVERVDRLALALAAKGVVVGDRVVWAGQNCHRLIELLLAAERLGAIVCPLNWRQSADELRFVLGDADPRLVVWQRAEIGETLIAVRDAAAPETPWIAHDDEYEPLLSSTPPTETPPTGSSPAPYDGSRPLLMLYTAAFEGRPAGSLLPGRSLQLQALYGMLFAGAGPDDVYLNAGPLFHVGTFKATLATLVAGGTNVFLRRVEAEELCRIIDAERCTGAFLQPPTLAAMEEANREGRYDLSSLRPKGRYRSGFGQTELGGVVTFVDADRPVLGSAGRPGPLSRVEILDGNGRAVRPGVAGEIVVRGPAVHSGYHRRPELTAQRRRHGWHHTADLGRREADGSISFLGPTGRMIKSAAENIYPAEVEACLRTHPTVADVAVVGVPDPVWGQSVRAVIVPVNGARPTLAELQDHCRAQIASYKKPTSIVLMDALPRSGGAIDYNAMQAPGGL